MEPTRRAHTRRELRFTTHIQIDGKQQRNAPGMLRNGPAIEELGEKGENTRGGSKMEIFGDGAGRISILRHVHLPSHR